MQGDLFSSGWQPKLRTGADPLCYSQKWQDWLHADGLHLVDDAGEKWLANQIANAVAVPEPSSFLALGLIAALWAVRKRFVVYEDWQPKLRSGGRRRRCSFFPYP